MHYDRLAFTKNGEPTIVATGNENMEFGTPSKKLSSRDIFEINALYDCRASEYALFDIVFLKESVKGTVIIYRLLGEEGGGGVDKLGFCYDKIYLIPPHRLCSILVIPNHW